MKKLNVSLSLLAFALLGVTGCQTPSSQSTSATPPPAVQSATTASASAVPAPAAIAAPAQPDAAVMQAGPDGVIRVNAGASAPVKDPDGNTWVPDAGFVGGDVIERPDVEVTNVANSVIFKTEHFGMDSFACKLANGHYQVKLYFAETYEGITEAGDRVFSFNVQGKDFKDFDVYKTAGGPLKAVVITTDATVTNGVFLIKFTSNIENPQINGIEISPSPASP
jgi:hypothetical protein